MDVRLKNSDIMMTASGGTEYITGLEEAVQRVVLAATAKKGSFRYNRGFGIDLASLSADDSLLREKLESRLSEATANIKGVCAEVLSIDPESQRAVLRVTSGKESTTTEVYLNGNLQ